MPGIRYVPDVVWHSKVFWASLAVMILVILSYHNASGKMGIGHFFRKLLGSSSNKTSAPKVSYSSDGRSGYVHYQGPEASFALYYEFGGGNCVACISIPGPKTWEKETGIPPNRREAVLHFIGEQVVKDQTTFGAGYYKIEGDWLNIYV